MVPITERENFSTIHVLMKKTVSKKRRRSGLKYFYMLRRNVDGNHDRNICNENDDGKVVRKNR